MRRTLFYSRRVGPAWLAAMAVGALAVGARWLDALRPLPLDRRATYSVHVTSGADAGIGTLREAIVAADRSSGRVRIVVDAPRVVVTTPLPPLVNSQGVVLEGTGRSAVIEAGPDVGPLLDIASPDSVVSRVQLVGAEKEALIVRANGARISRVGVERSGTGIALAAGFDDLVVDGSDFSANGVGVLTSEASRHVTITDSHFARHRTAGIWAVAAREPRDTDGGPPSLTVHGNRFDDDGQALIVMNVDARIERNTIAGARTAAMLISGASAIVRSNRVRSGFGFGISADVLGHALIADNEIDHNCAGGILVRNGWNTDVLSNRLYANGYGIVMVMGRATRPNTVADNLVVHQFEDGLYIIGGSPIVRRNRVMDNRHAGLRIASLHTADSPPIESDPMLTANVVSGNEHDALQDEFRATTVGAAEHTADCAWRMRTDRPDLRQP